MGDLIEILIRLLTAVSAGALIGLERSYHGRPAGLRTHTLVCTASSLLMLLTVYQWELLAKMPIDTIRVDPTRMAQGIMTGIGFLGAGVIMKEQFTIRGLTTAASIWITAAIGILAGMGFYSATWSSTLITLVVLSLFGWMEKRLPSRKFAKLMIRFKSREVMSQAELNKLISDFGMKGTIPSYLLEDDGRFLEYRLTISTTNPYNFQRLAESLNTMEKTYEFSILPSDD